IVLDAHGDLEGLPLLPIGPGLLGGSLPFPAAGGLDVVLGQIRCTGIVDRRIVGGAVGGFAGLAGLVRLLCRARGGSDGLGRLRARPGLLTVVGCAGAQPDEQGGGGQGRQGPQTRTGGGAGSTEHACESSRCARVCADSSSSGSRRRRAGASMRTVSRGLQNSSTPPGPRSLARRRGSGPSTTWVSPAPSTSSADRVASTSGVSMETSSSSSRGRDASAG